MKTQLVRNVLTLDDLEKAKSKMDYEIEEVIRKNVSNFENQTQVAVKSINIHWNMGIADMVTLKGCIEIKVDLF